MSDSESVELLKKIVDLDPKGEHRPQQEVAVAEIESALLDSHHLLVEATTGTGKALDVNTEIMTVDGWKTMGTLQPGDRIFDEKGQITTVTNTLDPFISEETYEITFSDGSTVTADAEHLWATSTRSLRESNPEGNSPALTAASLNVEELLSSLDLNSKRLPEMISVLNLSGYGLPRPLIISAAETLFPLTLNYDDTPLYDTRKLLEQVYICLLDEIKNRAKNSFTLKTLTTREIANTLKNDGYNNHAIPTVESSLAFSPKMLTIPPYTLGVWLANNSNHNYKDIPESYLQGSTEQRSLLLSGLLDTAGHANRNGVIKLSLTNQALITEARTLIESLGYKVTLKEMAAYHKEGTSEVKWTLSFATHKNPFLLPSKAQMFESKKGVGPSPRSRLRHIVKLEKIANTLVRCITVDSESHLFLAGKNFIPTHNTLSYLIPLIITGKRAVISTATKQLSEQITKEDIPLLQKMVSQISPDKVISSALLKGRENYFCHKKNDEAKKLDDDANTLFGNAEVGLPSSGKAKQMVKEIGNLSNWAQKTKTGDRSEAPAVSDDTWRQYSSTSAECPGKQTCPFGDICFAEAAREKAKKANVVITNHAVVAHDLMADSVLLGDREAFIFDELHELDNYLSSAWGTRLTAKMVKDSHKTLKQFMELGEKEIEEIERIGKKLDKGLLTLEEGLIESMPNELTRLLTSLNAATTRISMASSRKLQDANVSEPIKNVVSVIKKKADEIMSSTMLLLDDSIQTVRWVAVQDEVPSLYAAPLLVGPALQSALKKRGAIMIGTSATITVAGSFDIPVHNLDLDNTEKFKTIALGTPFDFGKQAMMYIPDPNDFPAPTGAERKEHTEAVKVAAKKLVGAMGGRALVLSTTTFGARSIGEYLRKSFPKQTILVQGEAPPAQLIESFKADEKSVLVATMGMWHGLNAPGQTCSLIIIDKIPFKPMDDPLSVARQRYADESGRSGFMDVYVAEANVMLAQGVGRLIRSKTDKGIVAILDTRLMSKTYGKSMLKSLPPMKIFSKESIVVDAAKRLAANYAKDEA